MLISYKRGQGSIVLRVKILNSSVSTGAGLTGLTSASAGLIIAAIADNEATTVAYTQAGSTIETITTLGTYAAPTATKCRFKEVDSTNHKGVYEIQIADARFAVSSAKSILISISGATNCAETDVCVPLTDIDPYEPIRAGLTSLPAFAAGANGGLPVLSSGATTLAYTVSTVTALTGLTASDVGAIKAKTDNLPSDPADQSIIIAATTAILSDTGDIKAKTDQLTFTVPLHVDATATATVDPGDIRDAIGLASADLDDQLDAILAAASLGGAGSVAYSVTVTDGSNPLDGAEVWVTTDSAGTNVVAGTLSTDAMGMVTFHLDPGTYYVFVAHSGYNGDNPLAITVTA